MRSIRIKLRGNISEEELMQALTTIIGGRVSSNLPSLQPDFSWFLDKNCDWSARLTRAGDQPYHSEGPVENFDVVEVFYRYSEGEDSRPEALYAALLRLQEEGLAV